ncbi:MAG: metalloregulator ArsR/SmtB family transcription factor [Xanthobacteraceae bacterium]|jgi:DNA-binding transcriptional ArsR family regulator
MDVDLRSNERRLAILCALTEGERSVGELVEAVGFTQSALSQHLAKLRNAGAARAKQWLRPSLFPFRIATR